jgi:pyridoxal phosphate enzyme (YggS family)
MSENFSLEARYQDIQDRIQKALKSRHVNEPISKLTFIAVSKKQPIDLIEKLYHLGHRDFGENYVQELIDKAIELNKRGCTEIRWHFIGHLQTNKVKSLLPYVYSIHTLDTIKLAKEIAKKWESSNQSGKLSVFIQVNIDEEETKSGIHPQDLSQVIQDFSKIPEIDIQGFMCIPDAEQDTRTSFIHLREISQNHSDMTHGMLSMGMSDDFETAIQEGATHVRVGSALFGVRN